MTPAQARELIETTLRDIVPDADFAALDPHEDLRDYLQLDSLDFLDLVERLGVRAGIRIEEEDYPELRTMADAAACVSRRAAP